MQKFPDEDACLAYLAEKKWSNQYTCRKCGHDTWIKGRKAFNRRCKRCSYDESPTAQTLFHNLKFSILDALFILYCVAVNKKGISSMQLYRETGVRQKTCWLFKRKVQEGMKEDEFYFGSTDMETQICTLPTNNKAMQKEHEVILMIKREETSNPKHATPRKYKMAYACQVGKVPVIKTYPEGTTTFNESILFGKSDGTATIARNRCSGFLAIQAANLKRWLWGVHHHCSARHVQAYLDEYHYRFNHRFDRYELFEILICNMLISPPLFEVLRNQGT
jgi:hypothetical protein